MGKTSWLLVACKGRFCQLRGWGFSASSYRVVVLQVLGYNSEAQVFSVKYFDKNTENEMHGNVSWRDIEIFQSPDQVHKYHPAASFNKTLVTRQTRMSMYKCMFYV
jgi:hypothetical protein